MSNEINYIENNIRILLLRGFNTIELIQLCNELDTSKQLVGQLPENPTKIQIASKILDFADRKDQIQFVLDWAGRHNQARYEKHKPYIDNGNNSPVINKAELVGSILDGADLGMSSLKYCNLQGVNMHKANLSGADLSGVNLRGADLSNADLTGVKLNNAKMRKADLTNVDLTSAILDNADLRATSTNGAKLPNTPKLRGKLAKFIADQYKKSGGGNE